METFLEIVRRYDGLTPVIFYQEGDGGQKHYFKWDGVSVWTNIMDPHKMPTTITSMNILQKYRVECWDSSCDGDSNNIVVAKLIKEYVAQGKDLMRELLEQNKKMRKCLEFFTDNLSYKIFGHEASEYREVARKCLKEIDEKCNKPHSVE